MKKLLIRADDFGYTEGTTFGILSLMEKQQKVSTGLMVNEEFSQNAAKLIKGKDNLCLGLHVCLTASQSAAPKEEIPSLVNEIGHLYPSIFYREKLTSGLEPFPNIDELTIEVKAQIERFIKFVGRIPDYIDYHAIYSPNLIAVIQSLGELYGIKHSPFYNESDIQASFLLKGEQLPLTNDFDYFRYLERQLMFTEGVNLLITHPAFLDPELFTKSSLNELRLFDYALLNAQDFYQWLAVQNVELITFNDL